MNPQWILFLYSCGVLAFVLLVMLIALCKPGGRADETSDRILKTIQEGQPVTTNPAITYTTADEQAQKKELKRLADLAYNQANTLRTCCGRSWGFSAAEARECIGLLADTVRGLQGAQP